MPGRIQLSHAQRAVRAFRHHAFLVIYGHTLARESNVHVRFLKAILLSARPIRSMPLVMDWYERRLVEKARKKPAA